MAKIILCSFLTLLLFLTKPIVSEIEVYQNWPFYRAPLIENLEYEALFSIKDAPEGLKPSCIEYDIEAVSYEQSQNTFLLIGKRESIIRAVNNPEKYVCQRYNPPLTDFTKTLIKVDNFNKSHVKGKFLVPKTGLYSAVLVPCGKGIVVKGRISFKNPYGYLSGHLYNSLFHYKLLAVLYCMLLCFWFGMLYKRRQFILFYHKMIAIVLISTFIEIVLHLFETHYVNTYGIKNSKIAILSRLFCVFRKTLTRTILLMISYGYGVLHRKIGKKFKAMVFSLDLSYFFLSHFLEMHRIDNTLLRESTGVHFSVLTIAIFVVDSLFYALILYRLFISIQEAKCREKYFYRVYLLFLGMIVFCLVTSMTFRFYEAVYFSSNILLSENWKNFWWYDFGFWYFQNAVVLMFIMYTWRPVSSDYSLLENQNMASDGSSNNSRNSLFVFDTTETANEVLSKRKKSLLSRNEGNKVSKEIIENGNKKLKVGYK